MGNVAGSAAGPPCQDSERSSDDCDTSHRTNRTALTGPKQRFEESRVATQGITGRRSPRVTCGPAR